MDFQQTTALEYHSAVDHVMKKFKPKKFGKFNEKLIARVSQF